MFDYDVIVAFDEQKRPPGFKWSLNCRALERHPLWLIAWSNLFNNTYYPCLLGGYFHQQIVIRLCGRILIKIRDERKTAMLI